ncbi:DUF6776 family protein [Alteromonas australica]|uniref:DUF6776 family protein n=1 Tax=Alteromonas australica TaxID=589873 RepID=UPI002353AF52|nr:DUF6776 family protein [Alteromonas australica]|tara:strand:+ start:9777 stop:10502 length:726 start_codon:yes stop_codon:yes gene_type:complete
MTTDELKQRLGNHKWSLLMALLMLLMIALGYKIARKLDAGDSQKVLAQADTIALLLEENNQLTTKVNQLEIALALEGEEKQNILAALTKERNSQVALIEKIAFYERVMSPENEQGGFSVEGVQIHPTDMAGQYQLRMVLLQQSKTKRVLRGDLSIAIVGDREGKEVTLNSSNTGSMPSKVAYRFKYFQAVNEVIQLPENVQPRDIVLTTTVYQYKTRKGKYTLSVPWQEAQQNGLNNQEEE